MKMKSIRNYLTVLVLSVVLIGCSSVSDPVFGRAGSLHRVSYGQPILNKDPYLDSIRNMEPPTPARVAAANTNSKTNSTVDTSYVEPIGAFTSNVQANQQGNLWTSLRSDFVLDHHDDNSRVAKQVHWYESHRKRLETLLDNSAPYLYYIFKEVKARNLPGEFALLPIIESAYDPYAYSYAGASGLWQLMPLTAHDYGTRHNWWYDGRRDIYASTQAALNYLTYLGSFFNDHWDLVLAAYNSGPGTLQTSINYNARRGAHTDYWSLYLPQQTQLYVPKLLALAVIVDHPERYGIVLPNIKDRPYFAAVKVTKQIKLSNAAKLAGTSVKTVEKLNPGYSHNVTAPNGTSRLLLPVTSVAAFEQNFHHYAGDIVKAWRDVEAPFHHYRVHAGDTLASIARRFKTTIATLETSNSIRPTQLHPNQVLMIPSKSSSHATVMAANDVTTSDSKTQTDVASTQINETSSATDDTTSATDTTENDSTTPALANKSYTVRVGDNLWSIAKKYHVTPADLRNWNHLPSTALKTGESLHIQAVQTADNTVNTKVTHKTFSAKKYTHHVVYTKRHHKKLHVRAARVHKIRHYNHRVTHYRHKTIKFHKTLLKKYSGKEYIAHGRKA